MQFSELCAVMWSLASVSATDALIGLVDDAGSRLENGEGALLLAHASGFTVDGLHEL